MAGEVAWAREQSRFGTAWLAGELELAGTEVWCEWSTLGPLRTGYRGLGVLPALAWRGLRGIEEGTFVQLFAGPAEGARRLIGFPVAEAALRPPAGAAPGTLYGDPIPAGHLLLRLADHLVWPILPPR